MISKHVDPIYDRHTPLSRWAGLPAEQLSTAYTNKLLVGLASTAMSFVTTELGKRWLQGLVGAGLAVTAFAGADKLRLDRRTRMDMHDQAATFMMLAVDPSPEEILAFQKDLLNFVQQSKTKGFASALKDNTFLSTNELQSYVNQIKNMNLELEAAGVPLVGLLNRFSGGIGDISLPGMPGKIESGKQPVHKDAFVSNGKKLVEHKPLFNDVMIRGGF